MNNRLAQVCASPQAQFELARRRENFAIPPMNESKKDLMISRSMTGFCRKPAVASSRHLRKLRLKLLFDALEDPQTRKSSLSSSTKVGHILALSILRLDPNLRGYHGVSNDLITLAHQEGRESICKMCHAAARCCCHADRAFRVKPPKKLLPLPSRKKIGACLSGH